MIYTILNTLALPEDRGKIEDWRVVYLYIYFVTSGQGDSPRVARRG
jgi:hypothetical protein